MNNQRTRGGRNYFSSSSPHINVRSSNSASHSPINKSIYSLDTTHQPITNKKLSPSNKTTHSTLNNKPSVVNKSTSPITILKPQKTNTANDKLQSSNKTTYSNVNKTTTPTYSVMNKNNSSTPRRSM